MGFLTAWLLSSAPVMSAADTPRTDETTNEILTPGVLKDIAQVEAEIDRLERDGVV